MLFSIIYLLRLQLYNTVAYTNTSHISVVVLSLDFVKTFPTEWKMEFIHFQSVQHKLWLIRKCYYIKCLMAMMIIHHIGKSISSLYTLGWHTKIDIYIYINVNKAVIPVAFCTFSHCTILFDELSWNTTLQETILVSKQQHICINQSVFKQTCMYKY